MKPDTYRFVFITLLALGSGIAGRQGGSQERCWCSVVA